MSRRQLPALYAAMVAALTCVQPVHAGVARRSFQVGAVVIASASVSSTVRASGGVIEIRAVGHRSARAALLVDGEVKAIGKSPAIATIPASGDVAVTVLY